MSGTDQLSAHLDRGWDLLSRAEFEGAAHSAFKALEIDPEAPEGHFLLGTISARNGRTNEALEHFQEATLLDDGYVDAFLAGAEVHLHRLQDIDGCLQLCDEVLSFVEDPRDVADATLLKFEALLTSGDRDGAAALLDGLPDHEFDDANIHYRIGWALHEVSRSDDARVNLKRALELNPANSDAHYYLGVLEADRGETRPAIGHWLRSLELDEDESRTATRRGNEEVEAMAREVLAHLPDSMKELLSSARLVVTPRPGLELVAEGTDPRIGVYFAGLAEQPMGGEAETEPVQLEAIFVYSLNLTRAFPEPSMLKTELSNAIAHEASHFFSIPEEEMEVMGLGGLHRLDEID